MREHEQRGLRKIKIICNHSYREFDGYKYDNEGWEGLLTLGNLNLYCICPFFFFFSSKVSWPGNSRVDGGDYGLG